MLREFRALFRALRTPAAAMAIAATLVAGCGIKGPLRLAPPPPAAVPTPGSTPATAPQPGAPASPLDAAASPQATEPRTGGTSAPPKP
jgi:predicted small lipoprotein YifL